MKRIQHHLKFVIFVFVLLAMIGSKAWAPTGTAKKAVRLAPAKPGAVGARHPLGSRLGEANPFTLAKADGASRQAGMHLNETYGKLPLSFEANRGQTDRQVKFLARGRGYMLFLTANEAVLALRKSSAISPQRSGVSDQPLVGRVPLYPSRGSPLLNLQSRVTNPRSLLPFPKSLSPSPEPPTLSPGSTAPAVLRMKLVGANPAARVKGLEELPGKSNYFIGNDPAKWRTNVPTYARVKYQGVYPGVDLVYYGNQGLLEYDFVVAPGADPKSIRLSVAAIYDRRLVEHSSTLQTSAVGIPLRAGPLQIDAAGDLVVDVGGDALRFHKPVAYQPAQGNQKSKITNRRLVDGRYVLTATNQIGFDVGPYDRTKPLVIDPVLRYSTFLGGSSDDFAFGIAVDASGNAYVVGSTRSTDFPTTAGTFQASNAGGTCIEASLAIPCLDVLVAKLNPRGTALLFSTYLGGSSDDFGFGIAVDAAGNAYVSGGTYSSDFPHFNPFQAANAGSEDAFVAKLNATGSSLVYSTFLGGRSFDYGVGIALDSGGNAYVTGGTYSTDFPTASPLQGTCGSCATGLADAFVAKVNATGSALVYSTFLGGSDFDYGVGIALDSGGNAYVTGQTSSIDFPTMNPFQASNMGATDAFVAKLNATGSALVYSTFLGGSDSEFSGGIAVDASGNAYVTGQTFSADFPTVKPIQPASAGAYIFGGGFVMEVNGVGSALVYSTYLGGNGGDSATAVAVDAAGNAFVSGFTNSADFPTSSPIQAANAGGYDAFVAKILPADAPGIGLSRLTLDFGTQTVATASGPQTVTVRNVGSEPLTIKKIVAAPRSRYAQTNTCPPSTTPLAVGGSCTVNLTFTPTIAGTNKGILLVVGNGTPRGRFVRLTGTGTTPPTPAAKARLTRAP